MVGRERLAGARRDEDRRREVARHHLEARGLVHGVADDRVGDAPAGADVAGDHVAGADADPGVERLVGAARIALRERPLQGARGPHRRAGVLRQRLERPAEHDDDAVAEELRDDAALALADAFDDRVVLGQHIDDADRIVPPRHGGEAAEVDEHRGRVDHFAAERDAALDRVARDRRADVAAEELARALGGAEIVDHRVEVGAELTELVGAPHRRAHRQVAPRDPRHRPS